MDPRDRLAARFTPLSDALRLAWEAEPHRRDELSPYAFFALLTREVERLLRAGEHAVLPAVFAEVERTLASDDPDAADAARTCFLEDLGSPAAYVHVLPWLGPRTLAFLRTWEAGARDPFLAPAAAEARLLAPLGAACPAFARGWPRAAPHVCAADGTTTTFGIADFAFEVVRALLERDPEALAPLLAAIDGLLAPTDRPLARAFERCFLGRLRELSLAQLDAIRPRLGPRARDYWDLHLGLGEPRFGVWHDGPPGARLLPATTLRRADAWGWTLAMPHGDAPGSLREQLLRDGRVVAEDDATIDEAGDAHARWTWNDDDPPGDYVLALSHGARELARFAFILE